MGNFRATVEDANQQVEQEQTARALNLAKRRLLNLIQPEQYVGEVYTLGYETAQVMIHDHHRREVGGIPSLCFLLATRIPTDRPTSDSNSAGSASEDVAVGLPAWTEEQVSSLDHTREDFSVILLRVMDAGRLPTDEEATRIRVQSAQSISGEPGVHWDSAQAMDSKTNYLLSFAGVRCRVIGTFYLDSSEENSVPTLEFGSDISNYYPNQGLKVYKPNGDALRMIVNYRTREVGNESRPVEIGNVRYASTNRGFQGVADIPFEIDPANLLDQKTALFGMTRTGKSNTTKVVLMSVFDLRYPENSDDGVSPRPTMRIGQVVFDPNGEYGNENDQNVALTNLWRLNVQQGEASDIVVYGEQEPGAEATTDGPTRRSIRINFFEDDNLQTGKAIIDSQIAHFDRIYMNNFRLVSFVRPNQDNYDNERRFQADLTRYRRRVLVYRTLLFNADFDPPRNDGNLRRNSQLFNQQLLTALRDSQSENRAEYQNAAQVLEQPNPEWGQLSTAFASLNRFILDPQSGYEEFNRNYANKRDGSGDNWADPDLLRLLAVFAYPAGMRQIGTARGQHSAASEGDYADAIYAELAAGKLVIVDQSLGAPELNKAAADRIMWKIFHRQQDLFRQGVTGDDFPRILVYVEEAHNILPSGTDLDLQDVWVRSAKEGAKYHIGMVYITQEVSSIQRNILKNTANWFIGHLNNTDETKELRKFYDFADFEQSILRAQDKGFLRVKTMSNPFVVPVQVNRFYIPDSENTQADGG